MKLSLNVATNPPEPRAAFALRASVLCVSVVLAVASVACTVRTAGELRKERAALDQVQVPASPEVTPVSDVAPYLRLASENKPGLTALLSRLEHELPPDTSLVELRWSGSTLDLTLRSTSETGLAAAESICTEAGFAVESHSSSERGAVALLRRDGGGR